MVDRLNLMLGKDMKYGKFFSPNNIKLKDSGRPMLSEIAHCPEKSYISYS